jgi:hypothetical protein
LDGHINGVKDIKTRKIYYEVTISSLFEKFFANIGFKMKSVNNIDYPSTNVADHLSPKKK